MTLCIAAEALYRTEPCLVLCGDWQLGDGISSTETTDKLDHAIGGGLVGMLSGTWDQVRDLREYCKAQIPTGQPSRLDLKRSLHKGITEFRKHCKALKRKDPDPEFIFCGFPRGERVIFTVNSQDVTEESDGGFKAVGSGGNFADPLLRWRYKNEPMDPFDNLGEVVYRVYEAKRFAETDDSVGKTMTTLAVMRAGRDPDTLFDLMQVDGAGLKALAQQYSIWGPQQLPEKREYVPDFPNVIRDPGGHSGGNP